jgi:hypothetical protein
MMYFIRNKTNRLLFSGVDGWGNFHTATAFTERVREMVELPIEGEWVEWSKPGLKAVDCTHDWYDHPKQEGVYLCAHCGGTQS